MLELTRVYHFSAGHRLENPALSNDANAALYGPCHRPHGHNYYLEVTVAGVPDPLTGMSVDLGVIDAANSDLDALMRDDEEIADRMEREHATELAARKQEVDAAIASAE